MASHAYNQFQRTMEKILVTLYANIPIGSTGAVGTLNPYYNQGIYNVVRSSTGVYVITFGLLPQLQIDKFYRLLTAKATILDASVTGLAMEVVADNAAAGSITIRFVGPTSSSVTTPVVTDPPSGAVILLEMVLKNSSI